MTTLKGSPLKSLNSIFLSGSDTDTNEFEITGSPTSNQIITIPDATTTLVGTDTADSLTNKLLIDVDNIRLDANTLSTTNTNGNLNISPNGNGIVSITTHTNITGQTFFSNDNNYFSSNYNNLNNGYTTNSAQTGGFVINYLPTSTTTNIDTGAFDTTSSVNVINASDFASGDIIQINNANLIANDGLYEVDSITSTKITIKTSTVENFSKNSFITDSTVSGSVTKINVSIIRSDTNGNWEVGKNSSTPITYNQLRFLNTDTIQTNDNTQTILSTISTNSSTVYHIKNTILALTTSDDEASTFTYEVSYFSNNTSTLTFLDEKKTIYNNSITNWDISTSSSDSNIFINITGENSKTIDWKNNYIINTLNN